MPVGSCTPRSCRRNGPRSNKTLCPAAPQGVPNPESGRNIAGRGAGVPLPTCLGLSDRRHVGVDRPGNVQRRAPGAPARPRDLAEYVARLSQGQLRALGFRPSKHTGRTRCPGITPLLALADKTTRAYGLHTQVETVQQVLLEGGGEDVLTVTENQKVLLQTLASLLTPGKFSPSPHDPEPRTDPGARLQPTRDSALGMP